MLAHYQGRWRYLHIDEYQDTNRAQYLWVKLLAQEHRNLAVVGDDDQSIYSWRGADLRNILDFEADYPEATVVKLEQNYRSTQLILDAAHAVVARNEDRTDKKLWTENPRGQLIERFEADREDEEAEWVARQIEALVAGRGSAGSILSRRADDGDDQEYRLQDVAVMYRTNAQSRAIEEAFLRYGLRYQLVGGTRFYQRREIKDALAYLRTLRNDHDVAAFERIVNVPPRGIGQRSLESLRGLANDRGSDYWAALAAVADGAGELTPRARNSLMAFRDARRADALPGGADGACPSCSTRCSRRAAIGPCSWMARRTARTAGTTSSSCARSWTATATSTPRTRSIVCSRRPPSWPTRMPTPATPTRSRSSRFMPPRAWSSRWSSSRGLEEGVFPHARALEDPRQMEEERRLAYVGLTRARQRLYLTHAAQRATWGRSGFSVPSRFLLEIPEELMHGPRLVSRDEDDDQRPYDERLEGYDLSAVIGRRASDTRLLGRPPVGPRGGRRLPPGGGYTPPPGAPRAGGTFRPSRDLAARREAYYGRVPAADDGSGDAPATPPADEWRVPPETSVPGEHRYRDGQKVRHKVFGEGQVVSSKLTRTDEEVTVAFPRQGIKKLMASLADLEIPGWASRSGHRRGA